MSKRHVGVALILSALVLAGAALFLWVTGSSDADDDQLAEEFRAAIAGGPVEDIDPNRTAPVALGAVGAVLFLGGVVLVASPSSDS